MENKKVGGGDGGFLASGVYVTNYLQCEAMSVDVSLTLNKYPPHFSTFYCFKILYFVVL